MIHDYVKELFKKTDYKAEVVYRKNSEKFLVVYYDKKNYVMMPLTGPYEEDVRNIEENYKNLTGVCNLCKLINIYKSEIDALSRTLNRRLFIDIAFSVELKHGIITIEWRGDISNKVVFDTYNFKAPEDKLLQLFIDASEKKSPIRYLESKISNYFTKCRREELVAFYNSKIKCSKSYNDMEVTYLAAKREYDALINNLESVNITGKIEEIPNILDLNAYGIEFSDKYICFRFNKYVKFYIKKDGAYDYVDLQFLAHFKYQCTVLNRVFYDIYLVMKENNCSIENIKIFSKYDRLYVANYYRCIEVQDCEGVYEFAKSTCEKIKEALSETNEEKLNKYIFLYNNNINLLRMCLTLDGVTSLDSFTHVCRAFGIDEIAALNIYERLITLLPKLKDSGIVDTYYFYGNYNYQITFECEDIFLLDCKEMRDSVVVSNSVNLFDMMNYLSEDVVKEKLETKEYVKKNSIDIIKAIYDENYNKRFEKSFKYCIVFLDKNSIPYLRMKTNRIEAKQIVGEGMYQKLVIFLDKKAKGLC